MWRGQQKDTGQDLVEYAIVFPVLMLMILGVFEFGRIIYSYNTISNAAREGTRLAILPWIRVNDEDINYLQLAVDAGKVECPYTGDPIIKRVCDRLLALPGRRWVTVSERFPPPGSTESWSAVHIEVEYNDKSAFLTNLLLQTVNPSGLVLKAAATMRLE